MMEVNLSSIPEYREVSPVETRGSETLAMLTSQSFFLIKKIVITKSLNLVKYVK